MNVISLCVVRPRYALVALLSLAICSAQALGCDKSEMKIHVGWSMKDTGFVEKNIQKEWAEIDAAYKDGPKLATCSKGGRSCAMRIAIEAAKEKFDDKACQIAVSTQKHPGGCVAGIAGNGVAAVADYLRSLP